MKAASHHFGLSESKITMFELCPRRLAVCSSARPRREGAGAQARFTIGYEVGDAACSLLPDGVMSEAKPHLSAALAATQALLAGDHNHPIFEATLQYDGVLVRINILEPDKVCQTEASL